MLFKHAFRIRNHLLQTTVIACLGYLVQDQYSWAVSKNAAGTPTLYAVPYVDGNFVESRRVSLALPREAFNANRDNLSKKWLSENWDRRVPDLDGASRGRRTILDPVPVATTRTGATPPPYFRVPPSQSPSAAANWANWQATTTAVHVNAAPQSSRITQVNCEK